MRRVIAAVLAAGLLLVPPLSVGVLADTTGGGPGIPVSIELTSGTVVARGAAVQLGMDLTCEAGAEPGDYLVEYGWAEVRQAVGRKIVVGYGGLGYGDGGPIVCDGQTVTHVEVWVRPETAPFKVGLAFVDVTLCAAVADNYQSYGCADEQGSLRLTRK
jgi:hypothetical protein